MLIRRFGLRAADSATGGERTVDVVASTEAVDSYGTVLKGWDLARYQRAPVVLWNHDRCGLPIGRAENVRLEGGQLLMSIRFVDASANPIAEQVYQGVRQGSICGVSVGFAPSSDIKVTMDEGAEVDTLDGLELLEVSLCPVPANPEAVADMTSVRSLGKDNEGMDPKLEELLRSLTGEKTIAGYISGLETLRATLASQGAERSEREVEAIMSVALAAGKVTPAQRTAYLRACGGDESGKGADPSRVRSLVDALPVAVVLDAPKIETPAPIKVEATEDEAALEQAARAFGMDVQSFRALVGKGV